MKRICILFVLFITTGLFILISVKTSESEVKKSFFSHEKNDKKKRLVKTNPTSAQTKYTPLSTDIFIPYWQIKKTDFTSPSIPVLKTVKKPQIIYFGVTVNEQGIDPDSIGVDITESGYKNIITIPTNQKGALLALRMSSVPVAETDTIAHDLIRIAHDHNYNGLLLDLEVHSLPTDAVVRQITSFVKKLSNQLADADLTLSMTLFGDQFYRPRPYDLAALKQYVDHFYIMAYDLHKASGEPGPNFPLRKGTFFDYDLVQAIDQFTSIIPPEKITVIFGMYGYDWIVDEKKRPLKKATSITLAQIRKKFTEKCSWKNCVIRRDPASEETEINYVESSPLAYHIVWFEDEQSVEKKIGALLKKGIVHYAFWAWGYY